MSEDWFDDLYPVFAVDGPHAGKVVCTTCFAALRIYYYDTLDDPFRPAIGSRLLGAYHLGGQPENPARAAYHWTPRSE